MPRNVFGLLFFMVFVTWAGFVTPVSAQATLDPTALNLLHDNQAFDLSPYIYVTRDSENDLSWREVLSRHENNIRGLRKRNDILNISFQSAPHYLVFKVHNSTNEKDWMLDFGRRADGRMGAVRSIYIYDATAEEMIVDGFIRPNAPEDLGRNLMGTAASIQLEPGETKTFLAYLIPDNGLPLTLPIKIMPQRLFLEIIYSRDFLRYAIIACFIGAIGFFVGIFFLQPRREYILFALYFIIQYSLYHNLDHTFFIPNPATGNYVGVLLCLGGVAIMWLTRAFLDLNRKEHKASYYLILVISILTAISISFVVFYLDYTAKIRSVLFFLPPTVGIVVSCILSLMHSRNERFGAGYLGLGWIVIMIGTILTKASYLEIFETSRHLINSFWYCVFPQAVLFLTATTYKYRAKQEIEMRQQLRLNQEAESVARLRQSKESADQQRLLRVLEREREVMEELRQRETLRTEEMRKAKEGADEANRAKSAFLAVISHEIRTPMTGIMGMVRLLLDTQLTKQQHEYTTTIQESGNTMLALLNDILDFEKIETGKMDIEIVSFDLHRLLRSVITLMSGRAKEQEIELLLDLKDNVPIYLMGDPTRIRQVLLNLVGNAIKFTPKGSVTLQVQNINDENSPQQIKEGKIHHAIYFAIKDTGIGITEEAQKQLFSPFAQADSSISRKFGGSGLGLVICKRLVEAMGSTINLNSKEDQGSTFFFTLHLAESEENKKQSGVGSLGVPETTKELEKENNKPIYNILIAEDNKINQKVMSGFLEKDAHNLTFADDGLAAVEKANADPYDLIFMDIEMPQLKGDEATKRIRESSGPNAQTPIIALTGNVMEDDIQSYYRAGLNDFLAKPVSPEQIERIIRSCQAGTLNNPVTPTENTEKPKQKSPFAYDADDNMPDLKPIETLPSHAEEQTKDGNITELDPEKFDEIMLGSLRDSLGSEQLKGLIDSLYDKTEEIIAQINAGIEANDAKEVHARGHELKGMAGNFGIKEVSSIAAKIEKAGSKKEIEKAKELAEKLPAEYEIARDVLSQWLEG